MERRQCFEKSKWKLGCGCIGRRCRGNAVTTTNKAVVGTNFTVGEKINVPVTQAATATAGVNNIKAEATTENVKAFHVRNKVTLTDGCYDS